MLGKMLVRDRSKSSRYFCGGLKEELGAADASLRIEKPAGFDFRARRISFAAGASFTKHNHATRPGIVYVESGEIIENRNGKSQKFQAGDTWIEDADTDHWLRNVSDKEAVIIMIDLPIKE